jgi:hypothetical protein
MNAWRLLADFSHLISIMVRGWPVKLAADSRQRDA